MGVNAAYAMETLGERGMADDRSLSERSIEGGCRASAYEPELPGEVTGGLEDIEYDRSSRREGGVFNQSRSGVSHEPRLIAGVMWVVRQMMGESECVGHPRRPFNATSEKETFSLPSVTR